MKFSQLGFIFQSWDRLGKFWLDSKNQTNFFWIIKKESNPLFTWTAKIISDCTKLDGKIEIFLTFLAGQKNRTDFGCSCKWGVKGKIGTETVLNSCQRLKNDVLESKSSFFMKFYWFPQVLIKIASKFPTNHK